uniref:Inulinase n=1 Tax=Rhodotorula paludigena TaxID=86838 RepID=A0A3S9SDH6_9BASI|nr:inulinase [Rhodotorula paludigena]
MKLLALAAFASGASAAVIAERQVLISSAIASATATGAVPPVESASSSIISSLESVTGSATTFAGSSATASSASASSATASNAISATGTTDSASSASASSTATSSYPTPPAAAPTGVAPEGDYSGPLRPQVHFSPPVGFMNDPNGLFRDTNGTWHLYYQYNPTELVAGNQHWGHATSPDLYTWTNQPIALFPPSEDAGMFSGSAVLDPNNTSGFFGNATEGVDNVVAIFTLFTPEKQTQDLAYSLDGGYTFELYEQNPVLDLNSTQFRDPKVFWYESDQRWVMVVALSVEFKVQVYTSPDLKEWTLQSEFANAGDRGLQYECPNLYEVPVNGTDERRWVLYLSINPGAPLGGSVGQYFIGSFNGTHFESDDAAVRYDGFASDYYAEQAFYNTGDEAIAIGWASNWKTTNLVPTGAEGWRSTMGLPRRHTLVNYTRLGYVLTSEPYQLETVHNASLLDNGTETATLSGNNSIEVDFDAPAVHFALEISLPDNSTSLLSDNSTLTMRLVSSSTNESLLMGYYYGGSNAGTSWVSRAETDGFSHPLFNEKFSHTGVDLATRFDGVWDRSILEFFVDNGTFHADATAFPTALVDRFEVATDGMPDGAEVTLRLWGLRSTWEQ